MDDAFESSIISYEYTVKIRVTKNNESTTTKNKLAFVIKFFNITLKDYIYTLR